VFVSVGREKRKKGGYGGKIKTKGPTPRQKEKGTKDIIPKTVITVAAVSQSRGQKRKKPKVRNQKQKPQKENQEEK